jgi:N-acetyl-D-muramate 6-phosphate phosphatase
MKSSFAAVLFDLDGTLADTAPDLAAAVNLMRTTRHLEPTPFAELRANASGGARGLLHAGFGITPDDSEFEAMRVEFLNNYEATLCQHSRLFEGIAVLLDNLNKQAVPWGIVTNKATRFTQPLVPLLKLQDAHCVISGDTTPHFKPHPAPLLEAAKQLNIAPQNCCYVGDDLRDIQAARAAGMYSIAAGWGYCGQTKPQSWDVDLLLRFPEELLEVVG